MPIDHLYVHVPFCESVCPFCCFDVRGGHVPDVATYLDRLALELAAATQRFEPLRPSTVYLGGGTPSMLSSEMFERLVALLETSGAWSNAVERTLEVHPSTASPSRVTCWVEAGVTRLSVGVQSFDDATLRALGRHHTAEQNREVLRRCTETGVVVCADLLAWRDRDVISRDVGEVLAAGVDHVSVYGLTIEQGTAFSRRGVIVDPDQQAEALECAQRLLCEAGFEHYEVSNYARPGKRSLHNCGYWLSHTWLGLGPSASSRLTTPRQVWCTTQAARLAWWSGESSGTCEIEQMSESADSMIFAGLRMAEGVDVGEIERRLGVALPADTMHQLDQLVERGVLGYRHNRYTAFPNNWLKLDGIMEHFA